MQNHQDSKRERVHTSLPPKRRRMLPDDPPRRMLPNTPPNAEESVNNETPNLRLSLPAKLRPSSSNSLTRRHSNRLSWNATFSLNRPLTITNDVITWYFGKFNDEEECGVTNLTSQMLYVNFIIPEGVELHNDRGRITTMINERIILEGFGHETLKIKQAGPINDKRDLIIEFIPSRFHDHGSRPIGRLFSVKKPFEKSLLKIGVL